MNVKWILKAKYWVIAYYLESRIATDVYLFRVVAINKRSKNGNISSLWIFFSGHVSPRSSFQSMSLENKARLRFLRGAECTYMEICCERVHSNYGVSITTGS